MQEKSRTLYRILCSSFFNPQILFEPFLLLPWDLTEGPSSQPLILSSLEFKVQEQEFGGWVPNICPEILKLVYCYSRFKMWNLSNFTYIMDYKGYCGLAWGLSCHGLHCCYWGNCSKFQRSDLQVNVGDASIHKFGTAYIDMTSVYNSFYLNENLRVWPLYEYCSELGNLKIPWAFITHMRVMCFF